MGWQDKFPRWETVYGWARIAQQWNLPLASRFHNSLPPECRQRIALTAHVANRHWQLAGAREAL